MTQIKKLADQFDSAYEVSDIAERARFDALLKDDSANSPRPALADLLYEIICLTKDLRKLEERMDEIEDNY